MFLTSMVLAQCKYQLYNELFVTYSLFNPA